MSNPKTWIDVAHTAIQVGLGALIGGGITLLVKRTEADLAKGQEIRRRRLELLEDSADAINSLYHEVIKLATAADHAIWGIDNAPPEVTRNEIIREARLQGRVDLDIHVEAALRAQSNMQILAESACEELIQEYLASVARFSSLINIESNEFNRESIDNQFQEIKRTRDILLKKIGESYNNIRSR